MFHRNGLAQPTEEASALFRLFAAHFPSLKVGVKVGGCIAPFPCDQKSRVFVVPSVSPSPPPSALPRSLPRPHPLTYTFRPPTSFLPPFLFHHPFPACLTTSTHSNSTSSLWLVPSKPLVSCLSSYHCDVYKAVMAMVSPLSQSYPISSPVQHATQPWLTYGPQASPPVARPRVSSSLQRLPVSRPRLSLPAVSRSPTDISQVCLLTQRRASHKPC